MPVRFEPPPDWPRPPDGWFPPPGWQPDPAWAPAPAGWVFLVDEEADQSVTGAQEVPARRPVRPSGYQSAWLGGYWTAGVLSLVFLVLAFTGTDVPGTSRLAVTFGALAAVLGALMATAVSRHGVTDVVFDKATAGARVISAGWFLLVLILVVLAVSETGAGVRELDDPGIAVASTQGLVSVIFGAVALTSVLKDGYTEYRVATAEAARLPVGSVPAGRG